jgi:predicted dienelactone hydrolase
MGPVRRKPVAALAAEGMLRRKRKIRAFGPFGLAVAALAIATASPLTAHEPLPSSCDSAASATCLYTSDLAYDVGEIGEVQLTDTARNNYDLPLVIRYPVGALGPRPVVIWHHGGTPSARGATRSEEWSRHLAAAGYVMVHPSRRMIADPAPFQAECRDNGFKLPDECAYWVTQHRYGPQNTHFLIDHLADVEALDPALAGLLDPDTIVVAGHSGGTSSVLANAGAWQRWRPGAPQYDERNDAPVAFLATGVQGPMYAGFQSGFHSPGVHRAIAEHSFAGIDRPFMFITGVGDETGEPPEARVTAWLTSTPGDKVLLWDTEAEAVHETMDIDRCDTPLRADHCTWIGSAGLAFLDAVVRQRPEAQAWIDSAALAVLSAGAIELHRR